MAAITIDQPRSGSCFLFEYDGGLGRERDDGRTDVVKDGVEIGSQALHAGSGSDGDQGDNQGVFNEILAFFPKDDALNLGVGVQQEMIHVQGILCNVAS